jgi:hypothetical protein
MTVFNEGRGAGEFLLSEANGNRSRDVVTVASGAGVIAPGTVLGKLTSGGKYTPSPATGSDGSQTAVAVALYGCDATSADQKVVVIARDAEVNTNLLAYASSVDDAAKKAAKATQLAAVGIIVR